MVQKTGEEREKKPYILVYNNACRECHVLNFVTKIKPEKKSLERQHTHIILNDEVDFFLRSKVKIKKCIQLSNLFFFKVQIIVTFTNKTFINYEVERSYSGKLCTRFVTRRFNNQSWVNQISPKNSDPFLLCHGVLHYLRSIFVVINQIKFPRFFHGR